MNQYVDNILHAFAQLDDDNEQLQRITALTPELNWVEDSEIDEMLTRMADLSGGIAPPVLDRGLEIVLGRLSRNAGQSKEAVANPERVEALGGLYLSLNQEARSRNYVLNWLANINTELALHQFCELIINSPPTCPNSVVVAFAPLLQHRRTIEASHVFPALLGGLQHPTVAAAILDLANFLTREKRVDDHPARDHIESLIKMLGMLTEQLTMLEEGKVPQGKSADEISRIVNDTVSLIASLCDALSLIGDERAIGKLNRAAELKHRRIRAESLSALCALGDVSAGQELVKLATEPVIRLRILKYAEELGLIDEIEERFSDENARAESQLAMWLAHPSNMGLAPKSLQSLDRRRLAWPGFDDEVECHLFQYTYELTNAGIDNIGIAGPIAHAFSMNLQHLDFSDVYACFAGWHCTHEEILELPIPQARLQRPGLVERLMARLSSEQIDEQLVRDVEPLFVGIFMGEEVLVAAGSQDGVLGTWVIDRDNVLWFPPDADGSPARNDLAYCIYKGRRLLGAFNPPEIWPGTETSCT